MQKRDAADHIKRLEARGASAHDGARRLQPSERVTTKEGENCRRANAGQRQSMAPLALG
jgi:hypothetical protein